MTPITEEDAERILVYALSTGRCAKLVQCLASGGSAEVIERLAALRLYNPETLTALMLDGEPVERLVPEPEVLITKLPDGRVAKLKLVPTAAMEGEAIVVAGSGPINMRPGRTPLFTLEVEA